MTSRQRMRTVGVAISATSVAIFQLIWCSTVIAADSPLVIRFDSGFGDFANGLATDNLGNAYVGGEVESIDRKREFAVLKYDSSGALQWTAKYQNAQHGTDAGGVRSMAVDAAGNIYAAGFVYTQVTLSIVNMDWLVVSYTPNGIERWSQRINGTSNVWDLASEVVVDAAGNVYVAGSIDDVSSAGRAGWTIIKYSPNGVPLWRHTDVRDDGTRDGIANLHFDAAGNLIGAGTNTSVQSGAQHKIATTKVDLNGNVIWRRLFSDTPMSDDVVTDLNLDAGGNVYLTGETVPSTNPELEHVPITLKYDSNGALQFVLRGDGAGGTSVAVDGLGDVVVSGTSLRENGITGLAATAKYDAAGNRKWLASGVSGSVAIDTLDNIYTFTSVLLSGTSDRSDLQTTKMSSDGSLAWSHRFDGKLTTANASSDNASALSLDSFDNLFVTSSAQDGSKNDIVTLRYAANVTPQQPPASINAPTNLNAGASSGKILLTWADKSGNEAAFAIERCQSKNCTNFVQITQVGANTTSYSDTGLSKSTVYSYRVRAVNGSTASPYSNIATATTPKK